MSLVLAGAGCAGPGPKLFPITPHWRESAAGGPDGGFDRYFDTDGDGRIDYAERLGADGMIVLLRFDSDGDGDFDLETLPPSLLPPSDTGVGRYVRHLIIILDSVPFDMVRNCWNRGRFRHFHPPSRVISPFPVMTDMCLADFFGVSPSRAVESQYYDGRRLNTGYGTYAREENSHWLSKVDYHLNFAAHSLAYFWPDAWFDHELRRIQDQFIERGRESFSPPRIAMDQKGPSGANKTPDPLRQSFIGYVVGTSALGAQMGRDGHQAGLVRLDRFCQWMIHRARGRLHITLLSDHGHKLRRSRSIELEEVLERCGYRVRKRLQRDEDVVIPAFGNVTCAAIHTKQPAAVASDLSGVEGVELAFYRDENGDIMVISRDGRARISRREDRYRYQTVLGDPLRLLPILDELARRGEVDPEGFVDDGILFKATADHEYPDALHRLWRAFHSLVEYTPDVLLSLEDGYHWGSEFMAKLVPLRAAHGGLNRFSSSGFVMTTVGRVDPVIRMEDLRGALGL